jgi:hypothetical protein
MKYRVKSVISKLYESKVSAPSILYEVDRTRQHPV